MTTATMTATNAPNPGRFLLLMLAVALFAAAIALSGHAVKKHGSEAVAVRAACDNGNEVSRWAASERPDKFYRVCDTGNGFGIQIYECKKDGSRRERSSFIPKATQHPAGSWLRIVEYLSAKSTQVAVGALCG